MRKTTIRKAIKNFTINSSQNNKAKILNNGSAALGLRHAEKVAKEKGVDFLIDLYFEAFRDGFVSVLNGQTVKKYSQDPQIQNIFEDAEAIASRYKKHTRIDLALINQACRSFEDGFVNYIKTYMIQIRINFKKKKLEKLKEGSVATPLEHDDKIERYRYWKKDY